MPAAVGSYYSSAFVRLEFISKHSSHNTFEVINRVVSYLSDTPSKDLSYFDAIAVAIAERLQINEIFSFDSHFEMMGLKLSAP